MYLTESVIREYEGRIDRLIESLNLESPTAPPLSVQEASTFDLRNSSYAPRNIIGFGFGELIGGVLQGVLVICMYVVRKVPSSDVHPDYLAEKLIPDRLKEPVLSDVIEVGRPRLLHHRNHTYPNHVPGGAEIGDHVAQASGTRGSRGENGDYYLLSCWHCIDGVQGTTGK